ncbi:isoprenylcysteine carboxylmethyltransferase family protein [Actinotalea sp. BY-33]|uniref:Isoprenylcysteine carboxylmethyltransferase family protein n=1 Tax=Actinotalea soli TaxID=2819234 RepID=A0A939RU78_9CELL|nr:isoprenylcysteine carboxylmethyltransferase family protein [Actinotalea soli]MBO1751000.1 isoprenylcysteine carboxylmethyltransferase family protein [Actinotalea soli]
MDTEDGLVAAQVAALAALGWPGRARWQLAPGTAAVAAGALVGGAALSLAGALRHGRLLTPRVAPPAAGELHEHGPYAVSRHPIYTGLLAAAAGWAVLRRRPEPLAAWLVLLVVLDTKARREEQHLVARYGERYRAYRARTPRLLTVPGRAGARRP